VKNAMKYNPTRKRMWIWWSKVRTNFCECGCFIEWRVEERM